MLLLAGRNGPGPGPFLFLWGLLALVGGGTLATRKAATRFQALVVNGLARRPEQQTKTRAVHPVFLRVLGSVFALCGMVALPIAINMIGRS